MEQIALAARHLNTLRDNWLNPSEWVEWQRTAEEQKAGFPARPVAKAGFEADLKKRTLTNLYNGSPDTLLAKPADCGKGCQAATPAPAGSAEPCRSRRPAWLANAHAALDKAVAAAYGWADYTPEMPDEEILRRLLRSNLARVGE